MKPTDAFFEKRLTTCVSQVCRGWNLSLSLILIALGAAACATGNGKTRAAVSAPVAAAERMAQAPREAELIDALLIYNAMASALAQGARAKAHPTLRFFATTAFAREQQRRQILQDWRAKSFAGLPISNADPVLLRAGVNFRKHEQLRSASGVRFDSLFMDLTPCLWT